MSESRTHFRTPWFGAPPGRYGIPDQRVGNPVWTTCVFIASALMLLAVLAIAAGGNGEAFGVLITVPMLLVATHAIARRIAAIDKNPRLVSMIMAGLCLKLMGSFVRYWVAVGVYKTGDYKDYDKWGRTIASSLRHGHVIVLSGRLAGTNFMRQLTGYLYLFTPSRVMSGFAVYGWLSFIGILFFWRAYRIAISPKHDVTYLKWLFLLPSLVYWPSAIGKDAFMLLAAGVAAYGVACLLTNRTLTGVVAVALGIGGMIMVRPQFALAVCGGLALAVLVRRERGGFVRTIVSLVFVAGMGAAVVQSASSFFGVAAFNQSSVTKALNHESAQSSQGGSAFTPVVVSSPVKFPLAAVTVLYRPFPFEVHSIQELGTAAEGAVLMILTARAFKSTMRALRRGRDRPYVWYCLGALLVFIVAFSGFSNFGLLARERGVIQPLFLVFLSLPRDLGDMFETTPPAPRHEQDAPPKPALR